MCRLIADDGPVAFVLVLGTECQPAFGLEGFSL